MNARARTVTNSSSGNPKKSQSNADCNGRFKIRFTLAPAHCVCTSAVWSTVDGKTIKENKYSKIQLLNCASNLELVASVRAYADLLDVVLWGNVHLYLKAGTCNEAAQGAETLQLAPGFKRRLSRRCIFSITTCRKPRARLFFLLKRSRRRRRVMLGVF